MPIDPARREAILRLMGNPQGAPTALPTPMPTPALRPGPIPPSGTGEPGPRGALPAARDGFFPTMGEIGQGIAERPASTALGILGGLSPMPVAGSALGGAAGALLEGRTGAGAAGEAVIQGGTEALTRGLLKPLDAMLGPSAEKVFTESLDTVARMQERAARLGVERFDRTVLGRGLRTLERRTGFDATPVRNATASLLAHRGAAARPDEITFSASNDRLLDFANRYSVGRDVLVNHHNQRIDDYVTSLQAELMDTYGGRLLSSGQSDELARELVATIRGDAVDPNSGFLNIARAPAIAIYNGLDELAGGQVMRVQSRRGAIPMTRGRHQEIFPEIGGARVDYQAIRRRAEIEDLANSYQSTQFSSGDPNIDTFVRRFIADPTPAGSKSYGEAQKDRQRIRELARNARLRADTKGQRQRIDDVVRPVERALTDGLERGLDEFMPGAGLSEWLRTADRIYARASNRYYGPAVSRWISLADDGSDASSSKIITQIIAPGTGHQTLKGGQIRAMRAAFTDPASLTPMLQGEGRTALAFDHLRELYTAHLISGAWDSGRGMLDGAKLRRSLDTELRSGRLTEFYTGADARVVSEIQDLARFTDALQSGFKSTRANVPEPSKSGAVRFRDTGTLARVGSDFMSALMNASGIAGPRQARIVARLLTNPQTARWLSTGYRLRPGSKAAVAIMTKLQVAGARESQLMDRIGDVRAAKLSQGLAWWNQDETPVTEAPSSAY